MSNAPAETKVKAGAVGGGIGAAAAAVAVWALDTYVFTKDGIPAPVEVLIDLLLPAAAAYAAGWLAPHTPHRTDETSAPPPAP